MRRGLGFAGIMALFLGGLAAPAQAAARTVTVTVAGIDRNGKQVAVQSTVVPLRGNAVPSGGPTYQLVPGTYYVGASVPTMAGGHLDSQTILERRITVTTSETVKLDARGGKLVTIWLNGADLGSPAIAGGCIRGGLGVIYPEPPATDLYVRRVKAAGLGFDWTMDVGQPRATVDLAGGTTGGIPADPAFRLKSAGLVRTVIAVRAGPVPDTAARWATQATASDRCALPGALGSGALPLRATVYRTPGLWRTEVDTSRGLGTYSCSNSWASRTYLAGRRYADAFEDAASGPSEAVPVITGRTLSFDPGPGYQFADPLQHGYEYCYAATVSLSRGARVLKKERFTGYAGPVRSFSATVRPGIWYTVRVSARQAEPHVAMPGRLLSPRTVMAWRFKATEGAVPVAVLSFLPERLAMDNAAAPRSITTVRVWSTQNDYVFRAGRGSEPRSLVVDISTDGGRTWHRVRVASHAGYWTFTARNPSSGYVSIRSTVVSRSGDSAVETIYRAYRIG